MRQVFLRRGLPPILIVAVLGAIALVGILPVQASPAHASEATIASRSVQLFAGRRGNNAWLALQLRRERIALDAQQNRLDRMSDVAAAVETFISDEKAASRDTSALEAALTAFNLQIKAAQAPHDNARSILKNPAGFDSNGKVTDATQAVETLRSAAQSLRDAHRIIRQATIDLRQAFKDFVKANKPNKTGDTAFEEANTDF